MTARAKLKGPLHGYEGNFELGVVDIDNPMFNAAHEGASGNPKTITAVVNRKHDVIFWLHSRGFIDDAQRKAGDRFLRLWERAGGAGARAMDYSKEPVDGNPPRTDDVERVSEAVFELRSVAKSLGRTDYNLLRNVICSRMSIAELAVKWERNGSNSKSMREYVGRRVRDALDVAAKEWGLVA